MPIGLASRYSFRNSSGSFATFAAIRRAADRAAVADVAGVADETALNGGRGTPPGFWCDACHSIGMPARN
jgi:hypothetical protein